MSRAELTKMAVEDGMKYVKMGCPGDAYVMKNSNPQDAAKLAKC